LRKVLQLVPRLPFPADDGGKIGILGIVRAYLALGASVRLVGFDEEESSDQFDDEMGRQLDLWYCEPIPAARVLLSKAQVALGIRSYVTSKYYSSRLRNTVLRQVDQWHPDIVHIDHSHMGRYGLAIKRQFPKQRVFLRAHNIESLIWQRRAQHAGNWLMRMICQRQAALTERFERQLFDQFDGIISISGSETKLIHEQSPRSNVYEMPAGCELQPPVPLRADTSDGPRLCFVGSMDYTANTDGLAWFIADVWPEIRSKLPQATLTIAGKSSKPLGFLSNVAGIEYVGYVSDVATVANRSDIAVVPLRIGGGMRIKLLDFLSRGLPTIATTIGGEGIPRIVNGHEVFKVADTAGQFAQQIATLAMSLELRRGLADAGRSLISARYSWLSLVGGFCDWARF
jgi:polysaccharide biosynthesis protein PslH